MVSVYIYQNSIHKAKMTRTREAGFWPLSVSNPRRKIGMYGIGHLKGHEFASTWWRTNQDYDVLGLNHDDLCDRLQLQWNRIGTNT